MKILIPLSFVGPGFNIEGLHNTIISIDNDASHKFKYVVFNFVTALPSFSLEEKDKWQKPWDKDKKREAHGRIVLVKGIAEIQEI